MSYPKNNRILVILFSFFYFSLSTSAQEFSVDTIQYMGDSDKRINFVFISDGYQESELELFKTDVEGIVNDIFNTCLLYTSPSPRDRQKSRMPSSA